MTADTATQLAALEQQVESLEQQKAQLEKSPVRNGRKIQKLNRTIWALREVIRKEQSA